MASENSKIYLESFKQSKESLNRSKLDPVLIDESDFMDY